MEYKIDEGRDYLVADVSLVSRTAGTQEILVEGIKTYTFIISLNSEKNQDTGIHFPVLKMNKLRFRGKGLVRLTDKD